MRGRKSDKNENSKSPASFRLDVSSVSSVSFCSPKRGEAQHKPSWAMRDQRAEEGVGKEIAASSALYARRFARVTHTQSRHTHKKRPGPFCFGLFASKNFFPRRREREKKVRNFPNQIFVKYFNLAVVFLASGN